MPNQFPVEIAPSQSREFHMAIDAERKSIRASLKIVVDRVAEPEDLRPSRWLVWKLFSRPNILQVVGRSA